MKRTSLFIIILLLNGSTMFAQVSVTSDGTPPDNSAMLDVISTAKGVLIPRTSAAERTNITTPAAGLMVYQTNETSGFYYYTGTVWQYLPALSSISAIRDANGDTKVQTEKNTNEDNIRFDVGGNERMVLYNGRLHLFFPLSNTYIGDGAGSNSTDGYENLFVGYSAGFSNSTGYNNMFLGAWSGYGNTDGYGNAFAGFYSGGSNSTGNANSFFGQLAGSSNGTGSFNSFFGESTGSGIDGSNNSFFGAEAGLSLTTGSNNILLGYKAGENLTTGSGNIIIGTDVDAPVAGANNQLVIGASDLLYGDLTNKQIGIGTSTPDNSALVEMTSTNKGFLPPRMTTVEINAIPSPAEGLIVYNTSLHILVVYDGTSWKGSDGKLYIGLSYGGGIIFYLDGTGLHGLISATSDQSTGAPWGCFGLEILGTGYVFGTGQANTTRIVNGCSEMGIAARICDDLVLNGYSDWFLPSYGELVTMYQIKTGIGGFANDAYWSSSEYDIIFAWVLYFSDGTQGIRSKNINYYVRAVRAF